MSEFFADSLNGKNPFLELGIRLTINTISTIILSYFIYYKNHRKRDYSFTLAVLNLLVFFVCFFLQSSQLSIGFAFGILAIFSILRYRTETLQIKEMTYIFVTITIALINSLITNDFHFGIMIFSDLFIIGVVFILEKFHLNKEGERLVLFEMIELVKPEQREELMSELRERTGLDITRIEIGRLDYMRDIAMIKIFFRNNDHG
jgi:hypothetical protein